MRTLGILGGMAWPSTAEAYKLINTAVQERLGGVHSAPLLVWSFDFAEIEALQAAGDWDRAGEVLAHAAVLLEAAGADGLMVCTNTMHMVADVIEAATSIPLLHIADATASAIQAAQVKRVGLLGTAFTMEKDFYRGRLEAHGLEVVVPADRADRAEVHRIIYEELVRGTIREPSRRFVMDVVAAMGTEGIDGVIAGCTEIELLISSDDLDIPLFPTTRIHVDAAVDWILGE